MPADLPEHDICHLLGKRVLLRQTKSGLRAGTDCVLLSAVPMKVEKVLELGSAVGQTLLCYGMRHNQASLLGVEYQADQVDLARLNALDNAMQARLRFIQGDFSDKRAMQSQGLDSDSMDLVLMNPPFFDQQKYSPPIHRQRQWTHIEQTPLADWLGHAVRYTRQFGYLAMIHIPERLPEILTLLQAKMGNIHVLPIQPRAGKSASRVIVIAQKSRWAPMRLLPSLVMHDGDGYSDLAQSILADAATLPISM